jgi:hypothetical protein
MAVITMPAVLAVRDFTWGQRRYDIEASSDVNGSSQARLFGPPRWLCSFQCPPGLSPADAAIWEAMLLQLRGRVNHLAVWDRNRPAPRGTVRGSLTLNATVSAGATSATINGGAGQAGTTVAVGDKFMLASGVGTSQLVQATSAVTLNGSGIGTFSFEPPARIAFSSGAAVTWDKPVAHFKQQSSEWAGRGITSQVFAGYGLDLLEDWTP